MDSTPESHLSEAVCQLNNGKDVNADTSTGWTSVLAHACWQGRIDVAEMLLMRGANVHGMDQNGHGTPLHSVKRPDIAELLIRHRADLERPTKHGNTPLMTAVHWGDATMVSTLLLHKADTSKRDAKGRTPLEISIVHGKGDCARLLANVA